MKKKKYIKLLGKQYPIYSDLNASQLKTIANYAEEELKDAKDHSETKNMSEIAVLAVLNIADKIINLKKEYEEKLLEFKNLKKEVEKMKTDLARIK